jgi:hypothetical protein
MKESMPTSQEREYHGLLLLRVIVSQRSFTKHTRRLIDMNASKSAKLYLEERLSPRSGVVAPNTDLLQMGLTA